MLIMSARLCSFSLCNDVGLHLIRAKQAFNVEHNRVFGVGMAILDITHKYNSNSTQISGFMLSINGY